MKKKVMMIAGLLAIGLVGFSQAVKDRQVIPVAVNLNQVLRMTITNGGNIEFVFNSIDDYRDGLSGDAVTSVTASGATGANAKTAIIGLTGRAAQAAGYRTLTLAVSTSISAAVNPTIVNGQNNPIVSAIRSAMTANPGGVLSTVTVPASAAKITGAEIYRFV